MFDNLTNLGYGIITFAIVIGVGIVILSKFGSSIDGCSVNDAAGGTWTYNTTSGLCGNTTDTANPSAATQNVFYLEGQMGSSGLTGWTPAIIALSVGMLFLGVFLTRGGRQV